MSRSVDFNWHEGDKGFDPEAVEQQPSPRSSQPRRAPRLAAREQTGGLRLGNLGLLLLGVLLGAAVGVAILTFQGQRNARADLKPVIELQHQALARSDPDLYASLIDPADPDWRESLLAAQTQTALLYDAGPPRVRRVRLQGGAQNTAEVEIEADYKGRPYRHLETFRLVDGQWRLARPQPGDWGETRTAQSEHLTLHYREGDASILAQLPRLEATTRAFCDRYDPPPPCHIELSIEPDPDLLPFHPGQGAWPPPSLAAQAGPAAATPDSQWITLDGVGGDALHIRLPSLRFVGLHGRAPHPLWWLAVTEAIGDAILRQALGPITGESGAVLTLWAAARGDVALWSERFSGVLLGAADATAIAVDSASIGGAFTSPTPGPASVEQRLAARAFALHLHARFGEADTLAWLHNARGIPVTNDTPLLHDQTPAQLRALRQ